MTGRRWRACSRASASARAGCASSARSRSFRRRSSTGSPRPIGHDHVALVAIEDEQPVAICRFVRDANDESTAEFACGVADDYQQRGIGTSLADRLAGRARELGIRHFRAVVLSTNRPGLQLVRHLGPIEHTSIEGTTLELRVAL